MERVVGFDRAECALPRIRHEVWEGFVFVNLDADALSFAETYPGLEEEILALAPSRDAVTVFRTS